MPNWIKHTISIVLVVLSLSIAALLVMNLRTSQKASELLQQANTLTAECKPVRTSVTRATDTSAHVTTIYECTGKVIPGQ